jgi:diguanylate cyclase (GGDEF)-like protein
MRHLRHLRHLTDELETLPQTVARRLVAPLYQQPLTMVMGAAMFMTLGVIGFLGTGSPWYVAGTAASLLCCVWRLWEIRQYRQRAAWATPAQWARRCFASFWVTGAVWGAWSLVLPFESNRFLVFMLINVQCTCVTAGAVRNNGVPAVAIGQILLALLPPAFICALSDSRYLNAFTPFVFVDFFGAVTMIRFLHGQTLAMMMADEEKSALLERLSASHQDLELANQHLEALATTDGLTGVANRRAFDLALVREWRRMTRSGEPIALLLVDIDFFKAFNDRYGHPAGDEALRLAAAAAGRVMRRPGDLLARYGGEEFVAILPATDLAAAMGIAERLRQQVEDIGLAHDGSPWGHVTVSVGVASLVATRGGRCEAVIDAADRGLYAAKGEGRNCARAAAVREEALLF